MKIREKAMEAIYGIANDIYWAREFSPNDPGYCLFIGSGCSLPLAPSYSELSERLLREMYPNVKDTNELFLRFKDEFQKEVYAIDKISLECICEGYRENKGEEALLRSLKREFEKEEYKKKTHEGYRILGELIKDGFFKIIFTTNIDTLIEDTFQEMGLDFHLFETISDYDKRPSLDKPCLYKLHGTYNKRADVAWRDVQQLHPKKAHHLTHFFESNTFIFVGYSMQDKDIYETLYYKVDPFVRERLKIYAVTLSGSKGNMKELLSKFTSIKGDISLGENVDNGGAFFFALKEGLKEIERGRNGKKDYTF
jgi:hypothetical protein